MCVLKIDCADIMLQIIELCDFQLSLLIIWYFESAKLY